VTKPYLVWLGVQQWREEMVGLNEGKTHVGTEKKSLFWQCFLVRITNPNTIFFTPLSFHSS
jgi:threonine/homoserine/homoserine lactone efflux protein